MHRGERWLFKLFFPPLELSGEMCWQVLSIDCVFRVNHKAGKHGGPYSLTKSKSMLEEEAASLWDQDKPTAFAIFKADQKKCYPDTYLDRCTQQAASNSLVNPRLSWHAQNKRKRQPSLFPYGPTASDLHKKRSSLPITDKNQDWGCLNCQWQKEGWGQEKGKGEFKEQSQLVEEGVQTMPQKQEAQLFWPWFPITSKLHPCLGWLCIAVLVLWAPHLTIASALKSMEWARGSNEGYYSLQVRAASNGLWALRGIVKSGAGFRVTEQLPLWWVPITLWSCDARLKCGQPFEEIQLLCIDRTVLQLSKNERWHGGRHCLREGAVIQHRRRHQGQQGR